MATYVARDEKALRVSATPPVVNGRLQGSVPVKVADLNNPADQRAIPVQYELFGPGDVVRLGAAAITRRFPAPGSSDAEETKRALVEFGAADLPWRYTPEAVAGQQLRPWLVLVVGRQEPDEIVLRPDGSVSLGVTTQAAHQLAESWKWAHVHQVDGPPISRLLGALDLAPETDYVACVVPAFAPDGSDAWTGAAPVAIDCYDHWSFRTGPLGDFPELAEQLHKAELVASDPAHPFGLAEVTYTRRGSGAPARFVLGAAGALRLPPDPAGPPDPADAAPDPAVAAEVAALTQRIVTPDGRGVITAPRYDSPFVTVANQAGFPPNGWIDQLQRDPRARGAAGIGAWNAIEWQDRIADAAAAKAGQLAIAGDRVRHVALGVEASRSIWRRRVPPLPDDLGADPVKTEAAAAALVAALGPVLGRLPAGGGGTVLDGIAGRTPQLGRALFSSAARRLLRHGPARTARAKNGAAGLGAILQAANGCPKQGTDPADIRPGRESAPGEVEEAIKEAVVAAARGDDALAGRILDRLGNAGAVASPGDLAAALLALAPARDGRPDPQAVDAFLGGEQHPDLTESVDGWAEWVDAMTPREPCAPINLVGLAQAVAAAVDPTADPAPAARRVLATLPGFTHIGPVEIEPEVDLPLWSFLSQRSPDWMLPGAGDLKDGDVVALATNPAFVDALLTGANLQATGELRWRNIPLITRWSPLRKFWQRAANEFDILPIKGWPPAASLGAPALAPAGRGSEAVVAFKTSLFRRYPATVVYLYEADPGFAAPAVGVKFDPPRRVDHTFTGTVGDDITFFGFPIEPLGLSKYWVVLEEPPAGYRFYDDEATPMPLPQPDNTHAADFAYNCFALPVRVLIGPLL